MKKNLNMNIAGMLFNIDEDAYSLLENYLKNLQSYFGRTDEDRELMSDFEARIAELLIEMTPSDTRIVDIDMIHRVIDRLGTPEDIFGADSPQHDNTTNEQANRHNTNEQNDSKHRKLYRDVDNAWMAGVMSGLAAYTGWNVMALRLIAVLITVLATGFFWIMVLAYIACWMIVPVAITAAQKLEMRGKPITMEEIGKEIKNNPLYTRTQDGSIERFGGCLLRGCFGLIVIFVVMPILLIIIAVMGGVLDMLIPDFPYQLHWMADSSLYTICAIISGSIIILVPLLTIIHSGVTAMSPNTPKIPKWLKTTAIIIWFVSIVVFIVLCCIFFFNGQNIQHIIDFTRSGYYDF